MAESFRFPKPIPRDTTAKIAVAMTENMRALEVWLNNTLVPTAEDGVTSHSELSDVATSDHHARYTDAEAVSAVGPVGESDHGALSGLGDDDHPQYLKLTGGTLTGNLVGTNVYANNFYDPSTFTGITMNANNMSFAVGNNSRMGISQSSGDITFRNKTTFAIELMWDESQGRWEFTSVPYVGTDAVLVEGDLDDYLALDGTHVMTDDLDMGDQTIDNTTGKGLCVYRTATQSISASSFTAVVWQGIEWDAGGAAGWNDIGGANPSRLTVNEDGVFHFDAQVYWTAPAGTTVQAQIYVNGSSTYWRTRENVDDAFARRQLSGTLKLTSGDYVELFVWHNDASSQNVGAWQTRLALTRVA